MRVREFARARRDLAVFADLIGAPLEPWQASDLKADAPISALLWGRQLGKSRAAAIRAVWRAYTGRGRRVLVVSGGGDLGSRRLLAEVRALVTSSDLLAGSVVDKSGSVVRLANGSEVRCVSGAETAIRGWSVDELVVDECQLISESVMAAALPTVAARKDARVLLLGTATAASGPFFDLVRRGETGDPSVFTAVRVARLVGGEADAPWLNATIIEAQRAAMSAPRFDAEFRCVWQSTADALLSRAIVERATVAMPAVSFGALRGPARLLGGVDWGATTDLSALTAIARLPGRERRFVVVCNHAWPAGTPLSNVIDDVATAPGHFAAITAERNGLGEPCAQELGRRIRERRVEDGGGPRRPRYVLLNPTLGLSPEEQLRRVGLAQRYGGHVPPWWAEVDDSRPFRTEFSGLHTTAENKAATWSTIGLAFEEGWLLLAADMPELVRELLLLRVELTPGGTERIEAAVGHDDRADSLVLACGPFRRRDGRWSSQLLHLMRVPGLPDVPLPATVPTAKRLRQHLYGPRRISSTISQTATTSTAAATAPTTTSQFIDGTAAGFEVPTVPAYASVDADGGLTLPAGMDPPGPPPPPWALAARNRLRALRAREAAPAAEEA